jgi:hypothetical protein
MLSPLSLAAGHKISKSVGFDIKTTRKETRTWKKDCTKDDMILFLYHVNHMLGFYNKITHGRGLRFKISSTFSHTYYLTYLLTYLLHRAESFLRS